MNMFLKVLLFSIVIFALYTLMKVYVLSKLKPSKMLKWVILALTVVFLFLPLPESLMAYGEIVTIIKSGIFVFFFLWFFDLVTGNMYKLNELSKGKKDIKIRPKAKPNRVKYLNQDKEEKK